MASGILLSVPYASPELQRRLDVVVVLFHSDPELLRACVRSVVAASARAGVAERFVFVDNGGGLPDLGDAPVGCSVIIGSGLNQGFGRAVNAAFSIVDAPSVLLLNPDAAVAEDAVAAFLRAAQTHPGALLGGTMLTGGAIDPDSVLDWDFSVERFVKRRRFLKAPVDHELDGVVPVEKVTGGALFGCTALLRDLGPFDQQFFLYAEDADLSRRAARTGVSLLRVPDARVQHVGSASARSFAGLVEFTRADAAVRLAAVHRPWIVSLAQRVELLVVTLLGMLIERDPGRRSARAARLRALRRWGFRRSRPGLDAADLTAVRRAGGGR